MSKPTKDSNYSFEHSVQRFEERYEKVLTLELYNKWNTLVKKWFLDKKDADFTLISEDNASKTNKSYIVKYNTEIGVVYFTFETERNCITTFLPPKSVEERLKKSKGKNKLN